MLNMEIARANLVGALSTVQMFVAKKPEYLMLRNVLLSATDGLLTIEATDLEVSYRVQVSCETRESGDMLVDARRLYELVKALPFGDLQLEDDGNHWLKIRSSREDDSAAAMEYEIAGLSADEFPRITVSDVRYILTNAKKLMEMIDMTIFAVATEHNRSAKLALQGINVESFEVDSAKTIRLVGCDGTRISLIDRVVNPDLELSQPVIIPRKGALGLRKMLERQAGYASIGIWVKDSLMYFGAENHIIAIRLLNEKYPPYQSVIDRIDGISVEFVRSDLMAALSRLIIMTSDDYKTIKMHIDSNRASLAILDNDIARAKETMQLSSDCAHLAVTFNGQNVLDMLSVMQSDVIQWTINDKGPCRITGSDDDGFIGVFMPMVA